MNNINVTINLSAEDRERIDALINALNSVGTPFSVKVPADAPEMPQEALEALLEEECPPEFEVFSAEEVLEEVTIVEPTHTNDDIRAKYTSLVLAGKKKEAMAIIKAYAPKVSEIPVEKLDEVWGLLIELEG